jgi:hypothetical protein
LLCGTPRLVVVLAVDSDGAFTAAPGVTAPSWMSDAGQQQILMEGIRLMVPPTEVHVAVGDACKIQQPSWRVAPKVEVPTPTAHA